MIPDQPVGLSDNILDVLVEIWLRPEDEKGDNNEN